MMDTGSSPAVLLHNVDMLSIDLQKTRAIMLSHGHYDHTGGLIEVLKRMKKDVPVIAHPKIFNAKIKMKPNLKFIGTSSFKSSDVQAAGDMLLFVTSPVKTAEGIMTTGEVERQVAFEKVEGFYTVDNGRFVEDIMLDDQSVMINIKNKGLVVIAGCAHSGIINTINHAQKITETDRVYAVLGGFHLAKADDKRIQATVHELLKLAPHFIGPCHCTGSKAVNKITEAFGGRCRRVHTGEIVKL